MNDGKCNGNNKCRCMEGYSGNHCEVDLHLKTGNCKKPCRNGICMQDNKCKCFKGFFGRYCNQRGNKTFILQQYHIGT